MQRESGHIDWVLLLSAAGLLLFSVAFVYSASAAIADARLGSSDKLFWSHAVRVLVGLFVILVCAKIDYRLWRRYSKIILFGAIALLLYVFVGGEVRNNATRWINFGGIGFQPSELAKYALILHLAALLARKQEYVKHFRSSFLPMIAWTAAVCILVALQPDLSTASVIFAIAVLVIFVGNASLLHLSGLALLGVGAAGLFAFAAEYRLRRLLAFWGETENYQLEQALLAFGNGGLLGVGPGQSRQRDFFLPESYGDFIFSIVGEEYGFLGVALILLAFTVIVWRGLKTARHAPDEFGRILAAGITVALGLYAFVHAAVTCGMLPTTGLPMPFISYGGSATVFAAAALGVLLNISAQAGVYPRRKTPEEAAWSGGFDAQSIQ